MSEILCPVCAHNINAHDERGCWRRAAPDVPHIRCGCKRSAQDVAIYAVEEARRKGWDMALTAISARFGEVWNELNEGELYEIFDPESS